MMSKGGPDMVDSLIKKYLVRSTRTDACSIEDGGLEELAKLTKSLKEPGTPYKENVAYRGKGFIQLELRKGYGFAIGLLQRPEISVIQWFASEGAELDWHKHNQYEWLLLFQGKMEIEFKEEIEVCCKKITKTVIGLAKCIRIDPNIEHRVRYLEDTWTLAVTIPQLKEWPGNE